MHSTKLSAFCDKVLEIGWLLAAIVTPLFFNIYSNNVFERDKWTTLRSIAVVMAAVWLARYVEERVSGKKGLRITWRTPLVLPTMFTVLVYLISTVFSLTPHVSIFGGYQRMRGTYSTLSCIVIFLIVLDRMRTRVQVDRFITVVILNSLPIALYGFIQHNELDPLPWGGDVTQRIASNMGNPIFVAAYMIMAALPTLARVVDAFRSILTEEDTGAADVLRAAAYIFMFLVQVISIGYSQSRGPLMGLVAGLGVWAFLGLLALQRAACREQPSQPRDLPKDLGLGLVFGVGSALAALGLALAVFYAGRGIFGASGDTLQWVALAVGLVALLGAWMALIITRLGWRWLWTSALLLALLGATGFMTINLVDPVREWIAERPQVGQLLGRLDDVLYGGGGTTGKVRNVIWQGALEMALPHEPIELPPTEDNPDWQPDVFNFLRPLVGHGPESMYVAYNRFYPPELGHLERRTATPDRSHNETMDSLVTTGLLGLAAYLWLFGGIFYFGLRWMGFLPDDWRRILFFALLAFGAVAAVVAVVLIPTLGPHFFCLAIPIGMVGGMFVYMVIYGFSAYWESGPASEIHPRFVILAGLLSAVVAHFVEINFGITIASTLTTFWVYVAMLVLLGMGFIREHEEEPAREEAEGKRRRSRKRRKRRQVAPPSSLPAWLGPTLALAVVGGFILGTMAFDFVTATGTQNADPLLTIWYAMTVMGNRTSQEACNGVWDPARGGCVSYGMMMVVGFTWLMGTVVFMAQMAKDGAFREHKSDWALATVLYLLVSLIIGLGFALVQAGRLHMPVSSVSQLADHIVRQLADHIAGHLTTYYGFILFTMIAGSVVLFIGGRRQPKEIAGWAGASALVVLSILAGITAISTNLVPIQADMVYKQAMFLERTEVDNSLALYKHAVEMTPLEDFYHFEQGRVYLMNVPTLGESALQNAVDQFTRAREIAPLNTDHSRGLAKVYEVWANHAEQAGDTEAFQGLLRLSSKNYEIATGLSPQNLLLWNEWSVFLFYRARDTAAYEQTIQHSLGVDTEFYETWLIQADVHIHLAGESEAAGQKEAAVAQWGEAATDLARALEVRSNARPESGRQIWHWTNHTSASAWYPYGIALYQTGQDREAIEALLKVLELYPNDQYVWDCHYWLALAYYRVEQTDQALYHAQMTLQLAPESLTPVDQSKVQNMQVLIAQLQAPPEGTGP